MSKSSEAFRTISEVSQALEVPAHVLRFWETKFSQIKPLKRGGGRRYYRPSDVALIKGIQILLYKEGFTIRGVQKILRDQGIKAVAEIGTGERQAASLTALHALTEGRAEDPATDYPANGAQAEQSGSGEKASAGHRAELETGENGSHTDLPKAASPTPAPGRAGAGQEPAQPQTRPQAGVLSSDQRQALTSALTRLQTIRTKLTTLKTLAGEGAAAAGKAASARAGLEGATGSAGAVVDDDDGVEITEDPGFGKVSNG